jgi:hypothetical protein
MCFDMHLEKTSSGRQGCFTLFLTGYQESVSRIPVKICSQDAGEVVFCGLACTCVENALVYIE